MQIIVGKPPVWDVCCAAFQVNPAKAVFTYGDRLYNPGNIVIPQYLLDHEEVHAEQQNHNDDDAALWWGKYLREPLFRADQEAKAYGVQYHEMCAKDRDRERKHRVLVELSSILSGPLYGRCIGQTEAMLLIKKYAGV